MPKHRRYCSLGCYRKSLRPNRQTGKLVLCETCGRQTYKRKRHLEKSTHYFCSFGCATKFQRQNKLKFVCKICNKEFYWSKSRITQTNPTYCSVKCRNRDREFVMSNSLKGNLAQYNKRGLNNFERAGSELLNSMNINHKIQVPMFNKFIVDVLIPETKLIIQWDGVYWHSKPKRKNLDKSQDAYLKKCGYNILRITDQEFKNKNLVYENIKRAMAKTAC